MANYNLGEAKGKITLEADLDGLKKGKQGLNDFKDASETAAKSPQKISGAFVAGMAVVGTAVVQATSVLISSVQSWVSEAVSASDATDKFRKAMEFAGVDGAAIDKAAARAQEYADKTVYSLSDIMNAVAQFTSNGVKDANGLVESIGNLNAVAGGSPESFQRMLLAITQTTAAGKLTTENWNQIADAIPGGAGVLMKALAQAGEPVGEGQNPSGTPPPPPDLGQPGLARDDPSGASFRASWAALVDPGWPWATGEKRSRLAVNQPS